MFSHSSRDSWIMCRVSQRCGLFKNSVGGLRVGLSRREVRGDESGSRPDRSGGLQHDATTRKVEVVAAEGKDVALVESVRSEAEHEHDRGAFLQQLREEQSVDRLLRIRLVRRDYDVAELGWEAPLGEVERLQTSPAGQISQVPSLLADARRPREPGSDLQGRQEILVKGTALGRDARADGAGPRPRDG